MIYNKHDALQSLKPNAKYAWFGYEYSGLKWSDTGSAPTESEIDADSDLKVKFSAFYNSIKAVKDANPKP